MRYNHATNHFLLYDFSIFRALCSNSNRRRSSTIRRSKTVEPPTNSEISNRFDVTRSVELNRSKSETHQDDPDLEAMVRGGVRVASVSSKGEKFIVNTNKIL